MIILFFILSSYVHVSMTAIKLHSSGGFRGKWALPRSLLSQRMQCIGTNNAKRITSCINNFTKYNNLAIVSKWFHPPQP